jgi:hypothetical protein
VSALFNFHGLLVITTFESIITLREKLTLPTACTSLVFPPLLNLGFGITQGLDNTPIPPKIFLLFVFCYFLKTFVWLF